MKPYGLPSHLRCCASCRRASMGDASRKHRARNVEKVRDIREGVRLWEETWLWDEDVQPDFEREAS